MHLRIVLHERAEVVAIWDELADDALLPHLSVPEALSSEMKLAGSALRQLVLSRSFWSCVVGSN